MSEHASSLLLALYFSVSHCLGSNTLEFNDELYKKRFQTRAEIINYLSGKTLVTERLSISSTTEDDIDQLAQYFTDEEYLRMYDMSLVWPKSIEEAKEHLKSKSMTDLKKEIYFFTIKLKGSDKQEEKDTCIGQLGFGRADEYLWVAYWIAQKYSHRKYMSEICPPMIKFFFEACEKDGVRALLISIHNDNVYSQKLAQKILEFINEDGKYDRFTNSVVNSAGDITYNEINYVLIGKKKGTQSEHQEVNLFLQEVHPGEGQKKKDKRLCSCCPCR